MSKVDPAVLMKDALQKIKTLQAQLDTVTKQKHEPIAIIGMGCRFPGNSNTPEQYWELLRQGVDAVVEMPRERRPGHADNQPLSPCYGGFLNQVDTFDPAFFGISPRETSMMDPQQRLLLEVCWEALESAYLVPATIFNSNAGVFIGMAGSDYALLTYRQDVQSAQEELYRLTGLLPSVAAGRLAYLLGFTGPAMVIDTACSSSLVAVHQACQSLRNGECNLALAGGVSLILSDHWADDSSAPDGRMYARDGRCKTFDAAANGFGRGEGCGVIVLKRLSDAQAAGDPILAVIRGSMVNQDGRSSGLSAPSGPSQQAVIRQALRNAGLEPGQVGYIEAHGTGTSLGDPIEIGALNAVFSKLTHPGRAGAAEPRTEPLWVGSAKTNFGHLEAAAGIAGLIKVVLGLRHGQIPPHLNFQNPNPYIDWNGSPVHIPTTLTPWPADKRVGGISSFGISGTNAHIILEAGDDVPAPRPAEHAAQLFTIAAKSEGALQAYAHRYQNFLAAQPTVNLGDLCYTSRHSRSHFSHRLSICADTTAQLQAKLTAYLAGERVTGLYQGVTPATPPRIAFLFTGQGAQYVNMGRALYTSQPTFRATIDHCDQLLRTHLGESILPLLYPDQEPENASDAAADATRITNYESRITNHESRGGHAGAQHASRNTNHESRNTQHAIDTTTYTQPALFILEYALATLWQSWGVLPDYLIGHSVGEIAAACVAGVFSLEDGLKLIAARGRLMGALPQDGAMVALQTAETQARQAIAAYFGDTTPTVTLAAINGPQSVVIAGERTATLAIAQTLAAAGIRTRPLTVSHAFHSPLMAPMVADFRAVAERITYHAPTLPLIANVTGTLAGAEIATPDYWVRHVSDAVRFADGFTTLLAQGVDLCLEIGPKPTLLGMAEQILDQRTSDQGASTVPLMLPSLRADRPDGQQMVTTLGALYTHGVAVNWSAVDQGGDYVRVPLPTYPFQHQRYWTTIAAKPVLAQGSTTVTSALLGLLNQGDVAQLTQRLSQATAFVPEELTLLPKVLTHLVQQHQNEQVAAELAQWLYGVAWSVQPRATTAPTTAATGTPQSWLIFADRGGVGQAIATQLQSAGHQAHVVYWGDTWQAADANHPTWTIAPNEPAELQRLLATVGTAPTRMLHLWSLDSAPAAEQTSSSLHAQQEVSCASVLHLVQTLLQTARPADAAAPTSQLWLVTRGAQAVGQATAPLALTQAPLWGLGKVVALEHPELWGGLIDLDPAMTVETAASALVTELLTATPEDQLAFRQEQRYVARLVRQPLAPAQPVTITADATYLITGGLGALGLHLAQWLAEQGARHLVLTGRRGLTTAEQRTAIAKLEGLGVQVQIAPMDVADEAAVAALLAELRNQQPPLRGIVHAAGVLDDGILLNQQWSRFAQVLAPKLLGGWHLHTYSQDLPLDFFVLFSSVTALLGAQGQSNYAAANAFLDALAHYRRQQGLPALSINWGAWAASGMAARTTQVHRSALQLLPPAAGVAAFGQLLGQQGQVGVFGLDWHQFTLPAGAKAAFLTEWLPRPTTAPVAPRSLYPEFAALPSRDRYEQLCRYLQQTVGDLLGMSEAPARQQGFADLGMDSLMAMAFKRRLESDWAQALPTTLAFEYPTVDRLATYLYHEVLRFDETTDTAPTAAGSRNGVASALVTTTSSPESDALAEAVAIIGIGCRFPGADSPEAFWRLLRDGVDMVTTIPATRWPVDEYFAAEPATPGKHYVRQGAFLEGIDQFDPQFFGIAPREAVSLDPQQRLLLEVSWEALERAGFALPQLVGSRTGVFVGIGQNDYAGLLPSAHDLTALDAYTATGNGFSFAAGRLAYVLGLQGPTMAIDTACSSSLVAVHLACQSLRQHECDQALAGGVNVILAPAVTVGLSQMQALAPDGRCKTFDAAANGYGRGEGCGVIVLKRYSEALADGDPILAVIRGSAVNHDGASSGLTVPNKTAQVSLIRQALTDAGVTPADVGYIDAHGTGTALGDPIELRALGEVFAPTRTEKLWIGSVKTNIGHLEPAAGIAGVIKTVLALQHDALPPHLHFVNPTPHVDWEALALQAPTTLRPWPTAQRIAGVSSFGLSGTNAHVVLAATPPAAQLQPAHQADQAEAVIAPPMPYLLTLSAKSQAALMALAGRYQDFLQAQPTSDLGDLCYTTHVGRTHFAHRLGIVAPSTAAIQALLADFTNGVTSDQLLVGHAPDHQPRPRIAFLFTGQGAQYVNMGRALYASQPTFRATIDHCDQLLRTHLGESILPLLYPDQEPENASDAAADATRITNYESRITNHESRGGHAGAQHASRNTNHESRNTQHAIDTTTYTQPALFLLEYALATLWQSWGVLPDYLIGHSVGEIAAACVAGVFSLEDGLKLIAARGRLMGALPQAGAMVALQTAESQARQAIAAYFGDTTPTVTLAAINGPQSVVIAGERTATLAIAQTLAAAGIRTRPLTVSHAFHSPLMAPMVADFQTVAERITYHAPTLPLIANVTGTLAGAEIATPDYWVRHVSDAVRFADGFTTLLAQGVDLCLEIGPKPTLLGMAEQILDQRTSDQGASTVPLMLPSLRADRPDGQQMVTTLGALYTHGVAVNWSAVDQPADPAHALRKVVLPTYAFQRQRYWGAATNGHQTAQGVRPLVNKLIKAPVRQETICESIFSVAALPFLDDHRVYDVVVSPGACQLAMVLSSAEAAFGVQDCTLEDIIFPEALALPTTQARTVQLLLAATTLPSTNSSVDFTLVSFAADDDNQRVATHATGQLRLLATQAPSVDLAALRARCQTAVPAERFYRTMAEQQIAFGPTFRWLRQLWLGEDEVVGQLQQPDALRTMAGYLLHPSLLDGCFQLVGAATATQTTAGQAMPLLPFAAAALHLYQPVQGKTWWGHARRVDERKWDLRLLDENGQVVVEIRGFEGRAAAPEAVQAAPTWRDWLYEVAWQPRPRFALQPDYLPTLANFAEQLQPLAQQWVAQPAMQDYRAASAQLEQVSIDYVLALFAQSGLTFTPGTVWRTDYLVWRLGVIPQQQRLLVRLLQMLVEEGILHQNGEQWVVQRTPDYREPQPQMAALHARYDAVVEAELTVFARCAEKLSDVLRGVQNPLELLFPGGDDNATARIYQSSPLAQCMNQLVQQALQTALKALPATRGVRILEIGGGTGGTTSGLLPLLPAHQTAYLFTDIGAAFTVKARQKFAAYSFVDYKTLDIESAPEAQGFARHTYDLVIAANVLHATKDLGATLTHVRQLLAPGGLLILLEATTRRRAADLIFGLTDGWWRFTDQRQDHPLLTTSEWETLLLAHGFAGITALPGTGQSDQTVLIAQADTASSAASARTWLLFADQAGVADHLAAAMRARGEQPILVYPGTATGQPTSDQRFLCPDDADGYRRLVAATPALHGVVYLWSAEQGSAQDNAPCTAQQNSTHALYLAQALLQQTDQPPTLWLVTRNAQAVRAGDGVTGFAQATLWGMGRVLTLEHPELPCIRIDVDDAPPADQAAQLLSELWQAQASQISGHPAEDQVAFRQGERLVERLVRHQPATLPTEPFQLTIAQRGALDNLTLQPLTRRPPAAHEVELRVKATGLNFRDLLNALGLYPGDAGALGLECTGEVVAAGAQVTQFAVGDLVMAIAPASFAQYVTVAEHLCVHKPANLSAVDGATIPSAFLTAYYCLHHLARIQPGERVLIHAATGGVGQAAVQLAQQAGAVVYGTASPGKWAALRDLGVQPIYNSRTLDFADQLLADTAGQGVDVVLNSLTGPGFVEKNLACLAPNGRFIEISKRYVWSSDQVAAVRPDVTYALVDLTAVTAQQPAQINAMLHTIADHLAHGRLRPLPATVFPISAAAQAFRTMQQAKHLGKLVITLPATNGRIDANATYLITGGLGGLGVLTARRLIEAGARHLLLLGRRGPTVAVQQQLDALTALGATITVTQADVTVAEQVADVLQAIDPAHPLRGIIHAVGVLDDGGVLQQNKERFAKVLAPKVTGAWHLHRLTASIPLDFFILYSSVAGLFGNRGQANHAAANAWLDAFAHFRQAQGLPAQSINWGGWSDIGAAADLVRQESQQLAAQGRGVIDPQRGIEVFAYLFGQPHTQVGVTPLVWPKFLASLASSWPYFAEFASTSTAAPVVEHKVQLGLRQQLAKSSGDARSKLLLDYLRATTAKILSLPAPEQIDPRQGLTDLGLDSLMAIEFRNHLVSSLEQKLPSTLLFDYPTLVALSSYLLQQVDKASNGTPGTHEQAGTPTLPVQQPELLPAGYESTSNGKHQNGHAGNGHVSNGHAGNGHVANGQGQHGDEALNDTIRQELEMLNELLGKPL